MAGGYPNYDAPTFGGSVAPSPLPAPKIGVASANMPSVQQGSDYTNKNPFYSDPVNRYFEDQVKRRVDDINGGTPDYLKNTFDTLSKQIVGTGGGSSHSGGGGGKPGGFGDGGTGRLRSYMDGRPMNEASSQLGGYIDGRANNQYGQGMKDYVSGRGDYTNEFRSYANDRTAELRGDPFDDTFMAAQRANAFDGLERDRNAMLSRSKEEMAGRGITDSSGAFGAGLDTVNRSFDTQRGTLQNQMVRDRFNLMQENRKQADTLQTTLGEFAKAGVSMNDAIRTQAASIGLSEQSATDLLHRDRASLTAQERQAKDSLESGLASLATQMRGQDTSLAGQLAQAGATSSAARYGAMGMLGNFAINRAQLENDRGNQGVATAGLLPSLVQGDMTGLSNLFSQSGGRF